MLLRTIISLVGVLSVLNSGWNRKGSSGPRDGCFKFGGTHVYHNELRVIFNFHVTSRNGNGKKGKQSKSTVQECQMFSHG